MKRFAMAALAASGLALLAGPAQAQRNGLYDVAGTNPDGTAYRGQMLIQQVGLASWRVAWQVGENRFEGFAMSSGPVFSVGFTLGDIPGVAIYQVSPSGSMTGQWTLIGSSAIGTENLTPRDAAPPARPNPPPAAAPAQPPQPSRPR